MPPQVTRVLIIGHSFIERLRRHIVNNVYPDFSPNLGLNDLGVRVNFLGFSGGNIFTLLDDVTRLKSCMEAFPADIVILQIGGNDIDKSDFNVDLYKASVRQFIFQLQELYNVKKVVVCEIFPRFKLRTTSISDYHLLRDRINLDFYLEFFHSQTVHFWRHYEGLMSERKLFLRDCVHLNFEGTYKFCRSLRGAILSLL